jgi:hypothetical protein
MGKSKAAGGTRPAGSDFDYQQKTKEQQIFDLLLSKYNLS